MARQTRSKGRADMKDTGETGPWAYDDIVEDLKAPMKEYFEKNYQYFQFGSPSNLTSDKKRILGFYDHAYAPIGTNNSLYAPLPGNMFETAKFEYILMPNKPKMATYDYLRLHTPQKTYMSIQYYNALFNESLPCSYNDTWTPGNDRKKFKNDQSKIDQSKIEVLPEIMQECDDRLGDVGLNLETKVARKKKEKALKDRLARIKLLKEEKRRSRVALEEYLGAKIPGKVTVVPFRNDDGAICYAIKQGAMSTLDLRKCLTPFWTDSRAKKPGSGSRGFNTRNEKYLLSRPLKILVQAAAEQRFGPDCKKKFDLIVKHICSMEGMKNQLQVINDGTELADHILLAKDPFGFYAAYIHEKCVHEYMDYLRKPEKNEPTVMFGDEDDLKVIPDPAATTTNNQTSDMNSPVTQNANHNNNVLGLTGSQGQSFVPTAIKNPVRALPNRDFIGRMENLLDDAFHNNAARAKLAGSMRMTLDMNTPTSKKKKLKTEQETQLAQLRKPETLSLHDRPYDTRQSMIGLSWAKINGASGTRMDATKNKVQQGETMKTSAGLMAVTTLGWEHYKLTADSGRLMKSGCHIAEWLHLCAYSWGGPTQSTDYVQTVLGKSQEADNLVFGTSEANSCMTRYEKSWQKLIEHENTLFGTNPGIKQAHAAKVPDRLTGHLNVTRNPTNSYNHAGISDDAGDVWIDEKVGDRYKWTLKPDFLVNSQQTEPNLMKAARTFPCIAYSIEYDVTLNTRSKILDREKASSKTYFYPFSRRFYHRAENLLDRALYQYMILLTLVKEYNTHNEALSVFEDWFKTLLLPEKIVAPFKDVPSPPVASTDIRGINLGGQQSDPNLQLTSALQFLGFN